MNNEEFRTLIALLEDQLRGIGAAELADPRHYMAEPDDREVQLMHPFERLVAMLEALERKMAVEDRQTFDAAMVALNGAWRGEGPHGTVGDGPSGAVVEPARDGDLDLTTVDLGRAPDLREPRMMLRNLIGHLYESRSPESPA